METLGESPIVRRHLKHRGRKKVFHLNFIHLCWMLGRNGCQTWSLGVSQSSKALVSAHSEPQPPSLLQSNETRLGQRWLPHIKSQLLRSTGRDLASFLRGLREWPVPLDHLPLEPQNSTITNAFLRRKWQPSGSHENKASVLRFVVLALLK